jgi:hypothetical protein
MVAPTGESTYIRIGNFYNTTTVVIPIDTSHAQGATLIAQDSAHGNVRRGVDAMQPA